MTTIQKLEAARESLQSVDRKHQGIYCNVLAVRNILAEKQDQLRVEFIHNPNPQPLNIPNCTSVPNSLLFMQVSTDFARIRVILDHLESLPEFVEAEAIISPLVASVRELEAQLADEIEEKSARANVLREAEEAALAKAQAAVESDPAVIKARREFEAVGQPAKAKAKFEAAQA